MFVDAEPAVIEPDYTLEKVAGKFALKIFLSQIASTSGCDLHISKVRKGFRVDCNFPGAYNHGKWFEQLPSTIFNIPTYTPML